MVSPLQQAGAISDPRKSAPLHTNRFFTGLWTQRNPLRDAATPYLYEKFYSGSRYESLIDGLNVEISSRLTLKRRPGNSEYMPAMGGPFPLQRVNRFYEFREFDASQELIHVIADTAGINNSVAEITNPPVDPTVPGLISNKAAGAGPSFFQSVGNTLFWGDGVEVQKWIVCPLKWAPNTQFKLGDVVKNTHGDLMKNIGGSTQTIANFSLTTNVGTFIFVSRIPLEWAPGVVLTISGCTGPAAFLNGLTITIDSVSYNQVTFSYTHANVASAVETGAATVANGLSGGVTPSWNISGGSVTIDGGTQWINHGQSLRVWGVAAPLLAPIVANAPRPSPYPAWAASTYYSPSLVIVDSNNNLQKLTTSGVTGGAPPAWNIALGGTTNDGSAVWTNIGPASWQATHSYALGDIVKATWTYWVTVPGGHQTLCFANTKIKTSKGLKRFEECDEYEWVLTNLGPRLARLIINDYEGEMIDMGDGELVTPTHEIWDEDGFYPAHLVFPPTEFARVHFKGKVYNFCVQTGNDAERNYQLANGRIAHNISDYNGEDGSYSYEVNASAFFKCIQAGMSGTSQPAWQDGVGITVSDGTARWQNIGAVQTWASVGATTSVSNAQFIIDSNGNLEQISIPGKSGAAPPAWKTAQGQTTTDGTASWLNQGGFSAPNVDNWIYGFAFKDSITGHVSTLSPLSPPIELQGNSLIAVQGNGCPDHVYDIIQIYRTVQGGSDMLLLDEIQNPFFYNPLVPNVWSYSDTANDSNLNEFIRAPINNANDPPPTAITALEYHLGRIFGAVGNAVYFSNVFTTNGVSNESFRPTDTFIFPSKVTRLWSTSIGLLVFTVSDVYVILGRGTSDSIFYATKFLEKLGLLHYDAFTVNGSTAYMMTSSAKVISLDPSSGVTEIGFPIGDLFLAQYDPASAYLTWHEGNSGDTALYVGDGTMRWYRMAPTSAPETGMVWSPEALITNGCSAIQSVETTPGHLELLIGPNGGSIGPVLKRDTTLNSDDGSPYIATATIGSIVLSQPGQLASLEFITLESVRVGTRPLLGLLLDEISGPFDTIQQTVQDPPLLPESTTIYNDRYSCSQNQTCTFCHHFQLQVSWAAEDVPTELLTYTIYGALFNEP